jgi:xanthine dehydrogenase accessory factor
MRGTDKLLWLVDGVPQLRRIALAAIATGCPVFVTLPPDAADRRAALAGLDFTPIEVDNPGEGIAASLRAGGAAASDRPVLVVPADMPNLTAEDLARFCRAHQQDPNALLRGESEGNPGHPVLFPADLVPSFSTLTGDRGARDLIATHSERLSAVQLPFSHAALDLDTQEEWAAWDLERSSSGQRFTAAAQLVPDPLRDLVKRPGPAAIAVITDAVGTTYRVPGAIMAFFTDWGPSGSLTNGCIEADLAIHAQKVMASGRPCHLRYGVGSPFFDIRLPCGGGIDIGVYPVTDRRVLSDALHVLEGRAPISIGFGPDGSSKLLAEADTKWRGDVFVLALEPETQAIILGDGLEARTVTQLLLASGIPTLLSSAKGNYDSPETSGGFFRTSATAGLDQALLLADPWTAIVTLFHDHEREIPILSAALRGSAFMVGAQGSKRVAIRREDQLKLNGLAETELRRLHAPVGLIPSTRDPQSLAVSILAAIVSSRLNMRPGPNG